MKILIMNVAEMKKSINEKMNTLNEEQLKELNNFISTINDSSFKEWNLSKHVNDIVNERAEVLKKLAK